MDQLILLPSILLHENNQLVADDLAALSWPGCNSSFSGRGGRTSSFLGGSRLTFTANGTFYVCKKRLLFIIYHLPIHYTYYLPLFNFCMTNYNAILISTEVGWRHFFINLNYNYLSLDN